MGYSSLNNNMKKFLKNHIDCDGFVLRAVIVDGYHKIDDSPMDKAELEMYCVHDGEKRTMI